MKKISSHLPIPSVNKSTILLQIELLYIAYTFASQYIFKYGKNITGNLNFNSAILNNKKKSTILFPK